MKKSTDCKTNSLTNLVSEYEHPREYAILVY